jgi:hypothetical protein
MKFWLRLSGPTHYHFRLDVLAHYESALPEPRKGATRP